MAPRAGDSSPLQRAAALHKEALDVLDLALAARGSERAWLLSSALELRRAARELEKDAGP